MNLMKKISYSCPSLESGQRGVSLVEVMVSMAIGLVIITLVSLIYFEGIRTLAFRQGQSENLGNGRYTLEALGLEFAKAGYRRDPTQLMRDAFPVEVASNECNFTAGQSIYVTSQGALCIRYQPRDDSEKDCAGRSGGISGLGPYKQASHPKEGGGMFVEKYYVANDKLYCQAGNEEVEMADGVRDIHFAFGVGGSVNDPYRPREVESYKESVGSDDAIRALRFSILLVSSNRVTGGIESNVCSRWKEASGRENCDAGNGYLYQIVSSALTLRNLMP